MFRQKDGCAPTQEPAYEVLFQILRLEPCFPDLLEVGRTPDLAKLARDRKRPLVGRVPCGRYPRGRNLVRWNLRVGGRPLPPGRCVVTVRALDRGGRIRARSRPPHAGRAERGSAELVQGRTRRRCRRRGRGKGDEPEPPPLFSAGRSGQPGITSSRPTRSGLRSPKAHGSARRRPMEKRLRGALRVVDTPTEDHAEVVRRRPEDWSRRA
jgi:hypothetical protein